MEKRYFKSDWQDVATHPLPGWYDDCKLGIFITWGLYSVPAWAEVTWEFGEKPIGREWMTHCPYAEWYRNTISIEDSPARKHHNKVYGKDFPYEKFADSFLCERYDPDGWAKLFKEAGAGYVVPTFKHHDGFCLYPSKYSDYNSAELGPKRDLMGELAHAVRANGLKMAAYYSGLLDWTKFPPRGNEPVPKEYYNHTFGFSDYSFNQAMEIIDRYKPSILWNDIGWPRKGWDDLPFLFS